MPYSRHPYYRHSPVIPIFLACALLFISCGLLDKGDDGGGDTGPQEEHVNALPNLAADSTNIAYLEFENGLRLPYYRTYDLNLKNGSGSEYPDHHTEIVYLFRRPAAG